jgi:hypothetical protein
MDYISNRYLEEAQSNPEGQGILSTIVHNFWFKFGSTLLIVVCPVILYVNQYLIIKRAKSVGSFSHWLCFVLIFGSTARTIFYTGEPFNTPMLLQGFSLIIVQVTYHFSQTPK